MDFMHCPQLPWEVPAGLFHEPCSQRNPMPACLPKHNATFLMTPKEEAASETLDRGKGSSFSQTCCSNVQAQGPC